MSLAIYLELERMGFRVWYDNRADDLTKEGMLKGIELSAAFILCKCGLQTYSADSSPPLAAPLRPGPNTSPLKWRSHTALLPDGD